MGLKLYAAVFAVIMTGASGCERLAASRVAPLPQWVSEPPGSNANPIGAVALWSRCPSTQATFGLGLSQIGPRLASANAAFPVDHGASPGYSNVVAPLTQLYWSIAGDAFAPSPAKDPYESTVEYDARVAAIRSAKNDALHVRLMNQTYAVVVGAFRIEGMGEVKAFDPARPDAVAYNPNSGVLTPVREETFHSHTQPLQRIETVVKGQMNLATLEIRENHWERTYVIVENEDEVPFGSLPPMVTTDVQKRHPGLAFVVMGHLTGITQQKYVGYDSQFSGTRAESFERELQLVAEHVELRDVCSNEVLWHQRVTPREQATH